MRSRVFALLFFLLVLGGGVSGQPLDGQWQSSSGAGISIQTSQQGVAITVTPTTGQAQTWQGQWLRQWDRFTYLAANNEQVTGQAVTGDRIDLTSNKGNDTDNGEEPDERGESGGERYAGAASSLLS